MLVAGSTLLVRSFVRLTSVSPGYDPDHALLFSLSLPSERYPTLPQLSGFWTSLVDRVEHLPGVESAAVTESVPLINDFVSSVEVPGKTSDDLAKQPSANFYAVSPDFFKAMGIPLERGRGPLPTDTSESPRVAVVSRAFADRFFPGENPVGQRVRMSQGMRDDFAEVIGVAGDVRQYGLDRDITMGVYEPARQHPYFEAMTLVVRTAAAPESMAGSIRAVVRDLNPLLPVGQVQTLDSVVRGSVASRRFTTWLVGAFAAVALLLSALGVYGLISFSVNQRVQEIGVRMALGAGAGRVVAMIVGQGLKTCLAGIVLGVAGSLALTRLLGGLLVEVSALDPTSFVLAAVGVVAVALVACALPARRAARFDPLQALRLI